MPLRSFWSLPTRTVTAELDYLLLSTGAKKWFSIKAASLSLPPLSKHTHTHTISKATKVELILLSSGSTHKAHLSFIYLNKLAKKTQKNPSSLAYACVSLIEVDINCTVFFKDAINIIYIA